MIDLCVDTLIDLRQGRLEVRHIVRPIVGAFKIIGVTICYFILFIYKESCKILNIIVTI